MYRLTSLLIALFMATAALAEVSTLPPASGPVVLTVTGGPAAANGDRLATFDLGALMELGVAEVHTSTPWTEGVHRFEGVPLYRVLERLGVSEGTITAHALNDFSAMIPLADATPDGPLIAFRVDGMALTIECFGPLWLIYPYDDDPRWQSESVYARSIWQLESLVIGPPVIEEAGH